MGKTKRLIYNSIFGRKCLTKIGRNDKIETVINIVYLHILRTISNDHSFKSEFSVSKLNRSIFGIENR